MKNLIITKFLILIALTTFDAQSVSTFSKSSTLSSDTIYTLAIFPGCDKLNAKQNEISNCTNLKLLEYLHKAIVYPKVAKENDDDCIVVVEFLVSENGLIEEVKTIQDPGDGLGQAVIDAVYSMNKMKNKWKPATINGVPRKGIFKLPIKCSSKLKAK